MLDRSTLDRLRATPSDDGFVVSVFLGHGPDVDELRSMATRLKALMADVRHAVESGDLEPERRRQLLRDLEEAQSMSSELSADLGRGSALFVGGPAHLREHLTLPAAVRDRVVIDAAPYLRPLDAMLDHFHHYAAAVVNRRTVALYRFYMGELESWEEIPADEPVRKDNYGGFAGYAEHRVRGHAEEVTKRLYRSAAERVADLHRTGGFDLLAIGGNPSNTASFIAELPSQVRPTVAGTFVLDPHTATPADVRDFCRSVAAEYDQRVDEELIGRVADLAAAGGRGAIGLDAVMYAAEHGAVEMLLVAASGTEPGVGCPACGWLAREGDTCASCGSRTRSVADLVDALADRTRATGGGVRHILGETPLADEVVAALLRFIPAQI